MRSLDCCNKGSHITFAIKNQDTVHIFVIYKDQKHINKDVWQGDEHDYVSSCYKNLTDKKQGVIIEQVLEFENSDILHLRVEELSLYVMIHCEDSILIKKFDYENPSKIKELSSSNVFDNHISRNVQSNGNIDRPFLRYNTQRRFSACHLEHGDALGNPYVRLKENCLMKFYQSLNEIDKQNDPTNFLFSYDFKNLIAWSPAKFIKVICVDDMCKGFDQKNYCSKIFIC